MATLNEVAQEFLAQPRIAVAGVSRSGVGTANGIYKVLKERGGQVFPVNPNTEMVEGDKCYASVKDIPGGVDAIVIATRPELTARIVRDCAEAHVPRVWMHNNTLGPSSVSDEAVAFCKENGIQVIAGACPMMFIDPFHKVMRGMLGVMGRLPKPA